MNILPSFNLFHPVKPLLDEQDLISWFTYCSFLMVQFMLGYGALACRLTLCLYVAVIHEPTGPSPHSQFEHSSVPATVKKLFNLRSNFLTKRDAWAGTFEKYFSLRDTPRNDCPETLPEVRISLRPRGPKEDESLSEFQVEMIQLASQLNGDYILNTYPHIGQSMTVGEANRYAEDAVTRFLEAGKAALRAGANESVIVAMRPSLTSRTASGDYNGYVKTQ